jgi:tetratricopeptide (TPR) repeat protein
VAAQLAREGLDLEALLVDGIAGLGSATTDLATASAAVELVEVVAGPGGVEARPGIAAVWSTIAPGLRARIAERLRAFDEDPSPAFAALERAARVDPAFDAPPEGFLGWREELRAVWNDDERLRRLVERFFELGFVPAGLEEAVVERGLAWPTRASLAAIVGEAVRLAGRPADGGPDGWRTLDALTTDLCARLGTRQDAIARRLHAQVDALAGRFLLVARPDAPEHRRRLAVAQQLGHEPLHRLLGDQARAAALLGERDEALACARERVRLVDALAPLLTDLSREEAVAWDLRGWPADPLQLGGERVSARLDLAALLLDLGRGDEAVEAAAGAVGLHPDHAARAQLAHGETLLRLRRIDAARAALRAALEAVRPHERALRERIQARLDSLPPG